MENQQNNQIPKIIQQFWEGWNEKPPSDVLVRISETWKEQNPSWEYRLWNLKNSEPLLYKYFPWLVKRYKNYQYDVQRWDAIRYLILYLQGGVYVDMDYECLEPLDWLVKIQGCCFGLDPPEHNKIFNKSKIISNAFMATSPNHPFFKCIINKISISHSEAEDKFTQVLETTGPFMLTKLYDQYKNKDQIWLIPSEYISPISKHEVSMIIHGDATEEISNKLERAYAVHYFFGSWI